MELRTTHELTSRTTNSRKEVSELCLRLAMVPACVSVTDQQPTNDKPAKQLNKATVNSKKALMTACIIVGFERNLPKHSRTRSRLTSKG